VTDLTPKQIAWLEHKRAKREDPPAEPVLSNVFHAPKGSAPRAYRRAWSKLVEPGANKSRWRKALLRAERAAKRLR
jgi:hypothetical protein